jgi:hypothetical protein
LRLRNFVWQLYGLDNRLRHLSLYPQVDRLTLAQLVENFGFRDSLQKPDYWSNDRDFCRLVIARARSFGAASARPGRRLRECSEGAACRRDLVVLQQGLRRDGSDSADGARRRR